MSQHHLPESTPGVDVFPQFSTLYSLVAPEVETLTDPQLDWESDKWVWANWSIRRQVSHMASFLPGWLLRRWGPRLFPKGYAELGDLANLIDVASSIEIRWLDEARYKRISIILGFLERGLNLAQYILSRETLGSMREKEEPRPDTPPHWKKQFYKAHPTGVRWPGEDPQFSYITLEATFRHLYYEVITHLYNVQRLKRAQGLTTVVDIPYEGYWALDDWDRSEAI